MASLRATIWAASLCTSLAVLPKQYAHIELAVDELFEQLDWFSSAIFAYSAWERAFGEEGITKGACPDGLWVEPVLQTDCPLPSSAASLTSCPVAAEGEICFGTGNCTWPKDLGNCPTLPAGKQTILRKVATACKGQGSDFCEGLATGISMTSIVTFVVSTFFRPLTWILREVAAEGWQSVRICSLINGCCLFLITLALVLVACFTTMPGPLVAGVLVMVCGLYYIPLYCLWERPESMSRRRCVVQVPLLGIYAAYRMGPGDAQEFSEDVATYKACHRMLEDLPETVCAILDLYFFGASWPAAVDLAVTTCMVFYHVILFLHHIILGLLDLILAAKRSVDKVLDGILW